MAISIPEKIREKFLQELIKMYSNGEISAGKAAEMLGISRAEFYQILEEKKVPLPEKLNQSILKELQELKKIEAKQEKKEKQQK